MKKREFFRNAAILTATSLILRTIGIFFRIYISNRVGGEGMGLYQMIVSIYVLVSSFASAGLNTAVTRLCTDELACGSARGAKRILYLCICVSLIVGCASALGVIGSADAIAIYILNDARSSSSLKILTLGLPFMGVSSCIKGYFLARRKVTSSSIAQITEQLIRIPSILLILNLMENPGVEGACFAILLGDTVAEAASCLYMTISYLLDRRHLTVERKQIVTGEHRFKRILHIAVPITAGRYLSSGLRTAENVLVPSSLSRYTGTRDVALSQFGKLKGMALPLLFFPSSFLNAFSALLIPEISEANVLSQKRHMQRTIQKTLQITLLSSILIGGIFFVISEPLSNLVYHDGEVGQIMKALSILTPFMYLESVVVGLLKGLDQQSHSLLYSVLDSGSRILLILLLLPDFGLNGMYGVMIVSNLLTCLLNLQRLCRVSGVKIPLGRWVLFPTLSAVIGIGTINILDAMSAFRALNDLYLCLIASGILCGVYIFLLCASGCVRKTDFSVIRSIRKKSD